MRKLEENENDLTPEEIEKQKKIVNELYKKENGILKENNEGRRAFIDFVIRHPSLGNLGFEFYYGKHYYFGKNCWYLKKKYRNENFIIRKSDLDPKKTNQHTYNDCLKLQNMSCLSFSWVILLIAAFLRFRGLLWGEYQYLHPDERFLIWVGTDISPVNSFAEYWDTDSSSLNPHNQGHGFYVYGTLPLFIARYAVEWVYGLSGFNEMTNVGRFLSALADLMTVLLVYLVGAKVYKKWTGVLAASFSAFAVLQIQLSHFFTVDTFTTFFTMVVVYFAVRAAYDRIDLTRYGENNFSEQLSLIDDRASRRKTISSSRLTNFSKFVRNPFFFLYRSCDSSDSCCNGSDIRPPHEKSLHIKLPPDFFHSK